MIADATMSSYRILSDAPSHDSLTPRCANIPHGVCISIHDNNIEIVKGTNANRFICQE